MAKEYYDQKIGPNTDWGGDSSTGGKQVKGSRVQEYIKGEIAELREIYDNVKWVADHISIASEDDVRDIVRNWGHDETSQEV